MANLARAELSSKVLGILRKTQTDRTSGVAVSARFEAVETLTDRVLGWFGFTHASDYTMVPDAMRVAIELHRTGVTPDTLTRSDIEAADAATGGIMIAIWESLQLDERPF